MHGSRPKLYLAAPLFSAAELAFNKELKTALSPFFAVYLPQEDGLLLADAIRRGEDATVAARRVFTGDTEAIVSSEVILAVLDGRTVDEGVAFELGYAYAVGRPCYGLQTDPRRLLPIGNNPMIQQALTGVFADLNELLAWAPAFPRSGDTITEPGARTPAARVGRGGH
jgi:nucleoside 2-deoxyribosyltransferase